MANFDKALYPAPTGMDRGVSIEIEDPESVTIDTGDVEITLEPENDYGGDFDSNLAEILDEGELATISSGSSGHEL